MIYHHLYEKYKRNQSIKAGIIGAGQYGTAVITQSMYNPLLDIPIIADQSLKVAKRAYQYAGIDADDIIETDSYEKALQAIENRKYVIVQDPHILMKLPLDVVAEATGVPEAGAVYGYEAIKNGKHVAMINKETDSAIGPILHHLAQKAGLVYTPVDGDQHGLLMGLVAWARGIGLEVISAGKARDAEFIYDPSLKTVTCEADGKTVMETTIAELSKEEEVYVKPMPDNKVKEYFTARKKILSVLKAAGDFDLCELQIAANATGLAPEIPLTYQPAVRTSEIPKVLCLEEDGGILSKKGVIDVVTCLREGHEAGLGGGVFIVVSCENDYSRHILTTKGLLSNRNQKAALIYRPYHLCGVETSTSLLCAALLGISTGCETYLPTYDLVKTVQRDMKKGEVLEGDYTSDLKASIIPAAKRGDNIPIPAHLLNGNRLTRDVQAGTILTYDMVQQPEQSMLWKLRLEQERQFL